MQEKKKNQGYNLQEKSITPINLQDSSLVQENMELKKTLETCNQQIQVYQELQKLSDEGVYRYQVIQALSLLENLQEISKTLKGIGQALNNIGQIVDNKPIGESQEDTEE